MGLYDTFCGKVKCPRCGKQITFAVQTKEYNCYLQTFKIGDYIDTANKTYIHVLRSYCSECHSPINIYAVILNGQLKEYYTDCNSANEMITKLEHESCRNVVVEFLNDIEKSMPPNYELLIRTNHNPDGRSGTPKECGKWFVHLESCTGHKNDGNVKHESVYKEYGDNLYEMLLEVEKFIGERKGE